MNATCAVRLVVAVLLGLGADAARAQLDPFYLEVEREAQVAAGRGDAASAARLYRVACFGMLDEPARLAACTVHLARTQDAAKDVEGFRASFLRLATVEERFQGLSLSALAPEEKKAFARVAAARLTSQELALIPELAELVAAERAAEQAAASSVAAKPAKSKPKGRRPAPAAKAAGAGDVEAPEPIPAEATTPDATATGSGEVVAADAERLVEEESISADGVGAVAVPDPAGEPEAVAASADRERLDAARRRIAERPERSVVETELEAVRAIADRSPGDVEAARQAGDLAYLLGLWPVCADYYQRAGDPGSERPLERFYMAVCLFETGQTESAARILAPSADRLKRSPFVDDYLRRILGGPAAP